MDGQKEHTAKSFSESEIALLRAGLNRTHKEGKDYTSLKNSTNL